MGLTGALMLCGTASDVGKSRLTAGLCRVLARRGVRVAPFKAQNMSLNSFVTEGGHEVARSIAHQAAAANILPEVAMNPILLKPTAAHSSQLIVMGRPVGLMSSEEYSTTKETLIGVVAGALEDLRRRFDVVILEGAGGAAEINLLRGDLVNLPLARRASIPAVLVGDIERGGVFASIYGTAALLPSELRVVLAGFIINKFRGDLRLLDSGIDELERRTGLRSLGVVPHLGTLVMDAEDSMALNSTFPGVPPLDSGALDVVVLRLPHISNFNDLDPLLHETDVSLRYVRRARDLGDPDLIVIPGSKSTVADLQWLRNRGFDRAIALARTRASAVLGICAGYQMMGAMIIDGVESNVERVDGLALLDATTHFHAEKWTAQRVGVDDEGHPISGYQIHHGRTLAHDVTPWFFLDDARTAEGIRRSEDGLYATSLHGLFEADAFRHAFLTEIAEHRAKIFLPSPEPFAKVREREIDVVADAIEESLDLGLIFELIARGAR